ncbi:MAG: hypothetical protein ACOC3A_03520 [Thermodesulfobacteriota bacterium]
MRETTESKESDPTAEKPQAEKKQAKATANAAEQGSPGAKTKETPTGSPANPMTGDATPATDSAKKKGN